MIEDAKVGEKIWIERFAFPFAGRKRASRLIWGIVAEVYDDRLYVKVTNGRRHPDRILRRDLKHCYREEEALVISLEDLTNP